MVSRWMTPGEAAKALHISRSGAVWYADTGRLRTVRTPSGRRLLSASSVEEMRRARERRGKRTDQHRMK